MWHHFLRIPAGLALCFSSHRKAQSQMWMGSGVSVPHDGCQMFSSVDLRRIEWVSSSSDLSPISALRCRSTGIKGALPVDHTLTIKSVRAFKISNQFWFQAFRNNIPLLGVLNFFYIYIPSTIFSNLNRARFSIGRI